MNQPQMNEGKPHEAEWENNLTAGIKGMRRQVKSHMKDFPTREFRDHMRAARLETLLAFRSLLDKAIEKLEEKPHADEPKSGRITIE